MLTLTIFNPLRGTTQVQSVHTVDETIAHLSSGLVHRLTGSVRDPAVRAMMREINAWLGPAAAQGAMPPLLIAACGQDDLACCAITWRRRIPSGKLGHHRFKYWSRLRKGRLYRCRALDDLEAWIGEAERLQARPRFTPAEREHEVAFLVDLKDAYAFVSALEFSDTLGELCSCKPTPRRPSDGTAGGPAPGVTIPAR